LLSKINFKSFKILFGYFACFGVQSALNRLKMIISNLRLF
jgi:hypothetical protein